MTCSKLDVRLGAIDNIVFISSVSIWEIRIKEALGKIEIPTNFEEQFNLSPLRKIMVQKIRRGSAAIKVL